ncbi:hypothetical protein ILYODFUR_008670 [Ilyodon furcidens]|uniref:Secreted protein n=1 Tax=Ilyodon furcidens TaxID=33524 RepID=A0ABV0UFU4_9TELE
MSYMVVNVLLRGLVIYAVLGSECSYSNDLPSHSSDAANVATSASCPLLLASLGSPVVFSGKAEESPAQ